MPSKQTQNYKLSQWVRTDKVLMDDFNKDNAAIDAAIKAVDTKADGLASSKAEKSDVTSLRTAVSGKGNCSIHTQSYVGTGTHDYNNPMKLTFPAKPAIVFVHQRDRDGVTLTATYGQTYVVTQGLSPTGNIVSWSGNTMSWSSSSTPASQLDQANKDYDVVALIAES